MKKLFKNSIWAVFFILLLANVVIFLNGLKLGDEIAHYEKEINRLHQESIDLENSAYEFQSFSYASSMAAQLNFTEKSTPMYLDNLPYALK